MTDTEIDYSTLTHGDNIKLVIANLPPASVFALMQRGLTHVLGNEVASRVHGWAQGEGQANSEDRETVKAWKLANASAVSAKSDAVTADMVKAISDGTLGSRVSGPRLTPIETLKSQMARKEIETILRANKIKVPKGEDKVEMPDGQFTMAELVSRRLAKPENGDRIQKVAEKELANRAKQIAAVEAGAADAFAAL